MRIGDLCWMGRLQSGVPRRWKPARLHALVTSLRCCSHHSTPACSSVTHIVRMQHSQSPSQPICTSETKQPIASPGERLHRTANLSSAEAHSPQRPRSRWMVTSAEQSRKLCSMEIFVHTLSMRGVSGRSHTKHVRQTKSE